MFWTNWNAGSASIMSSYMNGRDVRAIISTHIQTPNGLTIDHSAEKLYWSDARDDKVERCNFDGTERVVFSITLLYFLMSKTPP
jgi:integrin beta 2